MSRTTAKAVVDISYLPPARNLNSAIEGGKQLPLSVVRKDSETTEIINPDRSNRQSYIRFFVVRQTFSTSWIVTMRQI